MKNIKLYFLYEYCMCIQVKTSAKFCNLYTLPHSSLIYTDINNSETTIIDAEKTISLIPYNILQIVNKSQNIGNIKRGIMTIV